MMGTDSKKILLIDLDDSRRTSRIALLEQAGYEVSLRKDAIAAERLDHEGEFDLVVLALHKEPVLAADYSDRLNKNTPRLPVLLLTDIGVFAPRGTLSPALAAGSPMELMQQIAKMLAGSTHIRELAST